MVTTIIFCILIMFIAITFPSAMLLPNVISEINTKGSIPFIVVMFVFAGGLFIGSIVLTVFQIRHKLKEKHKYEEKAQKQEQKADAMLEAINNNQSEFSTTIFDGEVVGTGERVDTDKNSVGNNGVEKTVRKIAYGVGRAVVLQKLIGSLIFAIISGVMLYFSLQPLFNLETIYLHNLELESIPTLNELYIHSSSSASESELIEGKWVYSHYKITYETNGITNKVYDEYIDYLEEKGFRSYYTEYYYLVNPEDTDYIYKVDISKYDDEITVIYDYVKKPSIYM